ncbi:barstar family protein [Novosphingobium lindaniclasticum]|uniref:Barstar (barnase inhibitor) domain-containing protein n=1 Tax=Novosphingobium lindaniclasticum LE124 TaxID=1096930 RepID=T0IU16_9SPHN|nr:barstar family protein [Novosphingobium lindaniclasticum]EQB13179.1 hypothetical protein L284_14550 [Novosphingobium lindaniclasticum LE124]
MNAPDTGKRIIIEGDAIRDIPSFYDEINRVFMAGEHWKLGQSLDALADLLYGGYGAMAGARQATILWRDIALSQAALGIETTLDFLRGRVLARSQFNGSSIAGQIAALEAGRGKTYFDIVLEVFADHPNIRFAQAPHGPDGYFHFARGAP